MPDLKTQIHSALNNFASGRLLENAKAVETGFKPVSTELNHGLSEFIRELKTFSSHRINTNRQTPGYPVWQSRFYEHIIRNETELERIREYITNNPLNWETDENYKG